MAIVYFDYTRNKLVDKRDPCNITSVPLHMDYEKGTVSKEGTDENGSDKWMHDDLPEECKYCGEEVDNAGGVACNSCIDKRKDTLE